MASLNGRPAEIEGLILSGQRASDWETPEDLTRMSVEAMARTTEFGRTLRSHGKLRLAGDGVTGSSAPMDAVGLTIDRFQRLVTATGAALEEVQYARGALPPAIVERTRLVLNAGPRQGSIVLAFAPETHPHAELSPNGAVQMIDPPQDQLADLAIADAMETISSLDEEDPLAETFVAGVSARGPRFASALRSFAEALSEANFDSDLAWQQPGRATLRTTLSASKASRIVSAISMRELDSESVAVVGILRTISDVTKLAIETDDGELVYIDGRGLPPHELEAAKWHSRVRVQTVMTPRTRPGSENTFAYVATSMELV